MLIVILTGLLHGQQPFRTGTDAVVVDVSVRDGGTAVRGLTAADFVLTDNGVRQRIDSVEAGTVPIDVTLVVDLSGHPGGTWAKPRTRTAVAEALREEVDDVAKVLRAGDRVRLLAADTSVQQVFPMTPVNAIPAIDRIAFDGMSSLYDTLTAALLQPVDSSRRHVVVARAKGVDTMSAVTAANLGAVAEQSDALFHLVLMETAADNDTATKAFQCQFIGLCSPTRRFGVPFTRRLAGGRPLHQLTPDGELLARAADATGGALHKTMTVVEPTLSGTFKRAFEDFRTTYLLRYTLQGTAAPGWHRIDVRLARPRDYTVRSRRGYLVEAPPPPASPRPLPARLDQLDDFVAAYDRQAFRDVLIGLRAVKSPRALLRDFEEAGNPWPGNPRREATFALELADNAVYASDASTRADAKELIDRFSRLVRHPLEPDPFERYWYFAALSILEGALQPIDTSRLAQRALERFPDEPRFLLSRAIAAEQARVFRPALSGAHEDIERHFKAAIQLPDVGAEARVRYGVFLHHTGRRHDALAQLQQPGAGVREDPYVRYLQHLFLGHVLLELGRRDEAIAAYREAQAIVPTAQSARVAMMNALLLSGDRAGAETLAEQIQVSPGDDVDPWRMYWQGQHRFHPQAMARLREMSR